MLTREIVIAANRRMLAAGIALGLFLPQIAEADGVRMLEFCKRSNREIVIAYVSGALERADMDSDTIAAALEGALKRSEIEKFGLKKAWVAVRNYCTPGGDIPYQAADIFCDYLLLNPAERRKATIDVLDASLQKAWPCPPIPTSR
ncbi:hypothetical protein HNQ36_005290 [Afipia massiliensis]|uniref:Rap1a immunity protein domain-containing protein n=1 Tax=Afipia massiliensis TaxID=211460 RepID=A0A840N4D3_9BRAD|nr:Rap1a/Tai family immunity protein [Afipia massiliensis]MBB5055279.1 hypothetical protein [Afipia massiliensis]